MESFNESDGVWALANAKAFVNHFGRASRLKGERRNKMCASFYLWSLMIHYRSHYHLRLTAQSNVSITSNDMPVLPASWSQQQHYTHNTSALTATEPMSTYPWWHFPPAEKRKQIFLPEAGVSILILDMSWQISKYKSKQAQHLLSLRKISIPIFIHSVLQLCTFFRLFL